MKLTKRLFLVITVLFAFLVLGAVSAGIWFFHVEVDEERIDKILADIVVSIPEMPPADQNRLMGLAEIADEIEKIQEGWTEDQEEASDDWKSQHFFERETVAPEDLKKLEVLFPEGGVVTLKFLTVMRRPYAVTPFNYRTPFVKDEKFNPYEAYKSLEYILIYCDYLALKGRWVEIWPLLDGMLLTSEDLSRPPASLFQMMIGASIRQSAIQWLSWLLQKSDIEKMPTVWLQLERRMAEICKSKGSFQDALHFEMFLFQAGAKETILQENPFHFFFERDWKIGMRYYLQLLALVDSGLETRVIFQKIKKLNFEPKLYLAPFSALMTASSLNERYVNFVKDETVLHGGLIAMALATYHLQHKQYPSQLQELPVTGKLGKLYEDPLAPDRSFRYRREREGYLLYSVGEDEKDDQGDKYDDLIFSRPPPPSAPQPPTVLYQPPIHPPSGITLMELIQRKPDEIIRSSITKQQLDEAISNIDELYVTIRGVPYFKDAHVFGMRILSVKRGSILYDAGYRQGDIALAINGIELDIKKGFDFFQKLKGETGFQILMWRDGKLVRLDVELHNF